MPNTYTTEQNPTKRCKACGRVLPLTEYSTSTRTDDGVSVRCKQCINEGKFGSRTYTATPTQKEQPAMDITKTLNETIREQSESLVSAYIAECERQIDEYDFRIAILKGSRHTVAVNLANARRKV